jgi:DNA repair protein RadD
VQSVFRQDHYSLGPIDAILIDEAHLVPKSGEGMYRTLIDKLKDGRPDLRVCGFSATPFRLDSGRLDQGEGRLFSDIVYSYGIRQGIEDGWLSPLISKPTTERGLDVRGVKKRGGEYVGSALEAAVDKDPITRAAVAEMVAAGQDRRSWLVFCAGIKHANHVAVALRSNGVSCQAITSETDERARARHIADFKAGRLRALTNANVLTTGFDAPETDMVVMLRKTLSAGLYIQMCGRGTRKAPGKDNCLILDFAGNVRTHGPVDLAEPLPRKAKTDSGDTAKTTEETVRAKECPTCHAYAPVNAAVCKWCGHEWPVEIRPKHEPTADTSAIILSRGPSLSREAKRLLPVEHEVIDWKFSRHDKPGAPPSLKVTYYAGLRTFVEWITLERDGWLRSKAESWWRFHAPGEAAPKTVNEALTKIGRLRRPATIKVRSGEFDEVVGRTCEAAVRRMGAGNR